MNLLNIPKYCFDPAEFEKEAPANEEAETRWQIAFIGRHNGQSLYNDLVQYHQQLLEKTLAVVQKEYEACLSFGRQVKSLASRLNHKEEDLSRLSSQIPKSSITNLEELRDCLKQRALIEERRSELKIKLRQPEAEKAMTTIESRLPDKAQAVAAVYLAPLLKEERRAKIKAKILRLLMDQVNDGKSVELVLLYHRCLLALGNDVSVECNEDIDVERLVDDAKSRLAFLADNEGIDIIKRVLFPQVSRSVKQFFSSSGEMSADCLAQKLRTLRDRLVAPLEDWLGIKLGRFFNALLADLKLSPSLYRSVRQAEMQRRLEEAIVVSKRFQDDVHVEPCSGNCCAVYSIVLDNYRLCCVEDNDLVDLRCCLILLTARYCNYVEGEFKRWKGDTGQCLRLSIKNWALASECCKCLGRRDAVEQILLARLQEHLMQLLKVELSALLCPSELFVAVENLPTMLVRRHGIRDEVRAQQYVDDAFSLIEEWYPRFPEDMACFVVCQLEKSYEAAIVKAMQAVDQVRSGLSKLRKSKWDGLAESRVMSQLKADVGRFAENVTHLYDGKPIPAVVQEALASLYKCVSLQMGE